ncbi:TonB-dependent receptor [Acinetobacter guillouiae]|uniref:TonB-dependent receptor n=1 Tax=Acinetobacter guillouiae TaxID=106649 RepID=A0A8X8KGA1_ACIGI|nr:TonB-dependent receptor [Acinetobacter guillouiae]MCF0263862.1 TonB-dependent receptor [Acinetobacter guillouiae]
MKIATQPSSLYIALFIAMSGISVSAAFAADDTTNKYSNSATYNFNITSTSLETALIQFTEQSSIQFIVPSELTLNKRSVALHGQYTAVQALSQILQGTGLSAKFVNETTFALTLTDSDQHVLDAVRVEGSNQTGNNGVYLGGINNADLSSLTGANGSRDLTATEGNSSYAQGNVTVGGNRPIAAQKVTQSVTVVGQQELQDKKAISLADALQSATGVYSLGANNAVQNAGFYTRGHAIDSFTTDGVSSKNFSPNSFASEMALYDHIEVLRGGDAFTGSSNSANPSASINLVRKKPLEQHQTTFEVSAGSWDHYRQVLDMTGPLNSVGTLRGRFIVSNDLNKNFWDHGDTSKQVLNGQLEYDFSPKTTLNIGASGGYAKSKPWAVSVLTDESFEFPRNFSTVFGGNKEETKSAGVNFSLDHQFNNEWSFKLQGNKDWRDIDSNTMSVSTRYDPLEKPRDRYTNNYFIYYPYVSTSSNASEGLVASLLGNINLFGLNQGVDFATTYAGNKSKFRSRNGANEEARMDFTDFRDIDFSSIHSSVNLGDMYLSSNDYKTYSAYLKLDLQPFNGLHILTGPRWTRMQPSGIQEGANKTEDNINIPSTAIRYDLNKNYSIYASYVDLFEYVNEYLTRSGKPLDPIEGNSQEIGIKFSNDDKNLTATLAVFKSKINNQIESEDTGSPRYNGPTYYENQSYQENNKGIDFSLDGKIKPYWQTSIGYKYTKKKYKQEPGKETSLMSGLPWHFKFSNQFNLSGNDFLDKITLGVSTAFISKRNEQGYRYPSGSFNKSDRIKVSESIKSYAVTDIFARYQINNNWNIQLNLNNVFDKKYTYASFPISAGTSFYGTPINYFFTLQSKF